MNKAIFALGFTTLAFGATTFHYRDQARVQRDAADALQARVHELENVPAAPPPPPEPIAAVADASSAIAPAPPPPLSATPPRTVAGFAVVPGPQVPVAGYTMRMDHNRELLENPEYREAMRAQQRIMLLDRYPDLAKAMHLSPDQQERLLDLLADQQMKAMTNMPPFRPDGTPPDENAVREFQQRMTKQQQDNQGELTALLGSSGMEQWKDYQNSLGARMQVRQMTSTFEATGDPLREDQAQALVAAITAENQRRNTEYGVVNKMGGRVTGQTGWTADPTDRTAMFEQMLQRTEQYNKRLHDAVAPVLSGEQLASFDAAQDRQLQMQRANLRMMRAQFEADSKDGVQQNGLMFNSGFVGATAVEPAR